MFIRKNRLNLALVFIILLFWSAVFAFELFSVVKLPNYQYPSGGQIFGKKLDLRLDHLEIKFDFYIDRNTEKTAHLKYENLFQTANYNSGLRAEMFRKDNLVQIFFLYPIGGGELKALDLDNVKIEEWHSAKLIYTKSKQTMKLYLDDKLVQSEGNINTDPSFHNIVSGYGFTNERPFNGLIHNFTLSYFPLKPYYKFGYILTLVFVLVIFRNLIFGAIKFSSNLVKTLGAYKSTIALLVALPFLYFIFNQIFTTRLADYNGVSPVELKNGLNPKRTSTIEFDFYIDEIKEKFEGIRYENLFQTADWNNGFRVEFARKSDSATLWGLVYTDRKLNQRVIDFGTMPSMNKWHHMKVAYLHDKNRVDVFLNGINIRSYQNANLNQDFSKVISGKAFGDRQFTGKIKNFTIQTKTTHKYLYFILALAFVGFFVYLVAKNSQRKFLDGIILLGIMVFFALFIFKCETYLVGENSIFRFIIILASLMAIVSLMLFSHNAKGALKLPAIFVSYALFLGYIALFFSSAMYMGGKFSEQTRRPYGLSIDEIAAIYQSSFSESLQFITSSFGYGYLFTIIFVPILLTCVAFYFLRKIKIEKPKFALGYVSYVVLAFALILPTTPVYPSVLWAGFARYSQIVDEMKLMAKNRESLQAQISVDSELKSTHILVLGESANKEHMGAYGYFRDNTPWLSSQKDSPNFILHDNSYAPYSHTVPSILKILTKANQYNQEPQNKSISIIDVLKKGGFGTYWISEQQRSMLDTPLSVIVGEADDARYVEEGGYIITAFKNRLSKLDKSKNNFIVVHLMGSHQEYEQRLIGVKDRYTKIDRKEIGKFARKENEKFVKRLLNPYDSTIKNTDKILKEIFELSKEAGVDSLIYLSDHGEDVLNQTFHNSANFGYGMVRVPLFFYFSDRYKEQNLDKFALLDKRKNDIFTNDLMYDTMLDLYNIRFDKNRIGGGV